MAKAIRCDRCLKFFQVDEDKRYWSIRLGKKHILSDVYGADNISEIDICPECREKFEAWILKGIEISKTRNCCDAEEELKYEH